MPGLRYSSGLEGCPPGDMYLIPMNKSAWHSVGDRLGLTMLWVNKSYSTGEVRLVSADWRDEPEVDFNMVSDERDLVRLDGGHAADGWDPVSPRGPAARRTRSSR